MFLVTTDPAATTTPLPILTGLPIPNLSLLPLAVKGWLTV